MDIRSFKIIAQALYNCTQKTIYGCDKECVDCKDNYLMGTLEEQLEFCGQILKWIENHEEECSYHTNYGR